jgi:hypothetical protein
LTRRIKMGYLNIMTNKKAAQKSKMYLVRFKADSNGFRGWNSVFATNLATAKRLLKNKVGNNYEDIDWSTLMKGVVAVHEDARLEKQFGSLFE